MNDTMDEYFQFLNNLHESGKTNMFGATPFLINAFGMTQKEARTVLTAWMAQF